MYKTFKINFVFFIFVILFIPLQSLAEPMRLVTKNYFIFVTNNCPEYYVVCDDVNYTGVSRKSGNSLTIKGSTWHSYASDGTPVRFLGYIFNNKGTTYKISEDGFLEVESKGKVLISEKGDWSNE